MESEHRMPNAPLTVTRVVCWFSCGDASAVATKLALKKYPRATVARIYLADEHPDNERFARDCADWFGREIVTVTSGRYRSIEDVWRQKRYMSGIAGAPCTSVMKKEVRIAFQQPDDLQVFGYTADEKPRAERFARHSPELNLWFPLVEAGLTKPDCHAIIREAGIELPAMYRLGFHNNNCIGCVKAQGAGYWNLVKEHFPEIFEARAKLSREIGCRLVKHKGKRIYLDELPEDAGKKPELEVACSPFCEQTLQVVA